MKALKCIESTYIQSLEEVYFLHAVTVYIPSSYFVGVLMYTFSFPIPERPVHPDVRGALRRCSWLCLQAPGSDASVSQLTHVYGLIQDRNAPINIHQSATINTFKKESSR